MPRCPSNALEDEVVDGFRKSIENVNIRVPSRPRKSGFRIGGIAKSRNPRPRITFNGIPRAPLTRIKLASNTCLKMNPIWLPKVLQHGSQIRDLFEVFRVPGSVWAERASRGCSQEQKLLRGIQMMSKSLQNPPHIVFNGIEKAPPTQLPKALQIEVEFWIFVEVLGICIFLHLCVPPTSTVWGLCSCDSCHKSCAAWLG